MIQQIIFFISFYPLRDISEFILIEEKINIVESLNFMLCFAFPELWLDISEH